MPKGFSYADAVTLLGGKGPLAKAIDHLLGGALSVATLGGSDAAIGLFDAKAEMVRLSGLLTDQINDSVRGLKRYDRNQRLLAAHGVLVVTALFEAFDGPSLSRADQATTVGSPPGETLVYRLLSTKVPMPSADRSYESLLIELDRWYANQIDATGLPRGRVPQRAVELYDQSHRRLAGEIPEFAIWAGRLEDRAAARGLGRLESALRRATSGRDPDEHRAALARVYRAELERSILGGETGGVTGDLALPTLGEAYVDPRFRVQPSGPGARPSAEEWWTDPIRSDFGAFLAAYLTTEQATEAPMLLLGQPGAGKSSLTRVLAARLPASDFFAVRVPLRDVPAEADIQDQAERSLRAAIGRTVEWASLAAGDALPVILLDGFDELLQATGLHHSNYLQRVADFQRREATLGRPVAVMVTSRIAVADRARLPDGGLVVRLEPFDDDQIARWTAIWNATNPTHPAATNPTNPTNPARPATTNPARPDAAGPGRPATNPMRPDVADPMRSDAAIPTHPATTNPASPDAAGPGRPATNPMRPATTPMRPDVADPMRPDAAIPTRPTAADPSRPDGANPTHPDGADRGRLAGADRDRLAGPGHERLGPADDLSAVAEHDRLAAGPGPLDPVVLTRFRELAEQPLLLLMLALYHAAGNALRDDAAPLDTGQLYERLLAQFALREVERAHPGQPDHRRAELVEDELIRLSVVAFAMFNRNRFWISERELDADLAGLDLTPSNVAQTDQFRTPLTAAQEMVGRFFFIQRSQALRDDHILQTYEFLHATFGEYLIARLLVQALREVVAIEAVGARGPRLRRQPQDDLIQTLLGYTPLTARNTILPFVSALIQDDERASFRASLVRRAGESVTRPGHTPGPYQPVDKRIDHWMATYSLNVVLLVLACGDELRASELFTGAADPADWLRGTALQWRAAVPGGMWLEALENVRVRRDWHDGRRDMVVRLAAAEPIPIDTNWSHRIRPGTPPRSAFLANFTLAPALTSMHLSNNLSDDTLLHALEPLLAEAPDALTTFVQHAGAPEPESVAHSLLRLWMTSTSDANQSELIAAYRLAASAVQAESLLSRERCAAIVLRSLIADAHRLPPADVLTLLNQLTTGPGTPESAY